MLTISHTRLKERELQSCGFFLSRWNMWPGNCVLWASQSPSSQEWRLLRGILAGSYSILWPRVTYAWGFKITSETWALMLTLEGGPVSALLFDGGTGQRSEQERSRTYAHAISSPMYGVQRRQAARACSTLGQGRCLTSLLALEMGEHDPAKKVVRDMLELWIDIWLHLTAAQRKKKVYRSWDLAKPRIVSPSRRQRWHGVKGPLTATIATLCELQWDPQGPVLWATVDGDQLSLVADGAAADPRHLRREISAAIDQQLWAQVAQHELGEGLQRSVDLCATRLHLARLRKRGQHKEANFLMACLTGALWPLQHQHDCPRSGETPIDPPCKRCEEGCAETFLHRHWFMCWKPV